MRLPGWMYPAVINTDTAEVYSDTYAGAWGDAKELDKLLQAYCIEKATLEARKQGHSVTEELLPDGAIKLTVQVAGGNA